MATPVLGRGGAGTDGAGTVARRGELVAQRAVRSALRVPGARRVMLSPAITLPGYWFATGCALIWGALCGPATFRTRRGLIVASGMPRRSFGRGGTTVGAVYLTNDNVSESVLSHELVHRDQWRRYGLAFIPLYVAAGANPRTNRYELEAGLTKGGYS